MSEYIAAYQRGWNGPVRLDTLRRWKRDYTRAMRLLVRHVALNEQPYHIETERQLNADIRKCVAKWREGK